MIPRGIPKSRDEWPDGLLEHLRDFRQGDIVASVPLHYWGDPANAVFELTREYEGQGDGVCTMMVDFGLITTQTCDIGEEDSPRPERPWVQIAPVYNAMAEIDGQRVLNGGERKLIEQGRRQHLLRVAELGDGSPTCTDGPRSIRTSWSVYSNL